ncbi:MAG: TonB-dependent receptor, partial [Bacteroidota bacterium]
ALGATATAEKAVGGWGRLTGVVEGRAEAYAPRNDLDPVVVTGYPATRRVATAGLELAVRWPRLKLDVLPSARVELSRDVRSGRDSNMVHRAADEAVDRAHPVFRLGLLRPLGAGAVARANVGRYARIPSFVELYGYNRGVVGNAELRPERGWNADVGVVVTQGGRGGRDGDQPTLLTSATLFGAEVEDLIGWRTYSYQTRAENVSRARIWGVELELRLRHRRLALTTQATLTDARDRGDIAASRGQQIAHHPRYRGYGRAEWRQPIGPVAWVTYADVDGSAGNFSTASRYGALPARALVGAGVGVEHAGSGVRFVVSALNITDTRTPDFPGYPLPGRSLYASLGWSSAEARSSNTQE